MGNHPTQELNEIENFEYLGHSNWTICSPLSPICTKRFSTFSPSYWEANSYLPQRANNGKGAFIQLQNWMRQGFSSAWGIQTGPFAAHWALLFQKIFNFFSFILGGQFLLPQMANNGKGRFIQLQNWMRQGVFSAWGIQTGPFAAHWTHFVPEDFQLFHLHTGRPILITPEG